MLIAPHEPPRFERLEADKSLEKRKFQRENSKARKSREREVEVEVEDEEVGGREECLHAAGPDRSKRRFTTLHADS